MLRNISSINVNKVCVNTLNVNHINTSGRSGSGIIHQISPDLLKSLVAVVICDGKDNDDKDRDVIRNLVDKDNPFVISNAAYKLNSGYGLYGMDFLCY